MKKYLISGAIALAAVVTAASPAAAASFTIPLDLTKNPTTAFFGNTSFSSGSFTDEFSFVIPNGTVNGSVISIALFDATFSNILDVAITDFALDGVSGTQITNGMVDIWTLPSSQLSAGTHKITVAGLWDTKGGSYSGTLNFSSAVPEPASWALMIGGVGLTGGMMRRKKAAFAAA